MSNLNVIKTLHSCIGSGIKAIVHSRKTRRPGAGGGGGEEGEGKRR